MTAVLSCDQCFEHTPAEALTAGCTFCGKGLVLPYVHYNLGKHVFMCAQCCMDGDGILLDIHKVKRKAFPQARKVPMGKQALKAPAEP